VVALEAVVRQGQEPLALVGQRVAHRPSSWIARYRPGVGNAVDPVGELTVEIIDGGEATRREEAVAKILDGPLDLALRKGCQLQRIRSLHLAYSG
jgi:hypothetical protein